MRWCADRTEYKLAKPKSVSDPETEVTTECRDNVRVYLERRKKYNVRLARRQLTYHFHSARSASNVVFPGQRKILPLLPAGRRPRVRPRGRGRAHGRFLPLPIRQLPAREGRERGEAHPFCRRQSCFFRGCLARKDGSWESTSRIHFCDPA